MPLSVNVVGEELLLLQVSLKPGLAELPIGMLALSLMLVIVAFAPDCEKEAFQICVIC